MKTKICTIIASTALIGGLTGCGNAFEALLGQDSVTYSALDANVKQQVSSSTGAPVNQTDSGLSQGSTTTPPKETDGGGTPNVPVEPEPKPTFSYNTYTIPSCHTGEVDMADLAMKCHDTLPLILTAKDASGERLLKNFGSFSENPQAIDDLKAETAQFEYEGTSVELLLCIDGDSDDSCLDEEIRDLRSLSFVSAKMLRYTAKYPKKADKYFQDACDHGQVKKIKDGLVLYHNKYDIEQEDTYTASAFVIDKVSDLVYSYIQNMEIPDTYVTESTGLVSPHLVLTEADMTYCKEVGGRMSMGCFIEGTDITVSKDVKLSVENLREGDEVLLSNGKTSKITKMIKGPEAKPVIEFTLSNNKKLTVTDEHPMLTAKGLLQAKNVPVGAKFLDADKNWVSIQSINTQAYKGLVYNLELDGDKEADHLIISNDIVTGDLFLQQQLSKSKNLPHQRAQLD